MNFENIKKYFIKAHEENKLFHSYLFVGKNLEKEKIIGIAQHILQNNDPKCPDLVIEDSTDTVRIEQIRELGKVLNLKPYTCSKKIFILFEAQRLSLDAANAFLKTLEEPPAHSYIFLTSSQPKALLPTIISRCITLRVSDKIDYDSQQSLISQLLNLNLAEKLALSDKLSKNPEALNELLQKWSMEIPKLALPIIKKKKILYYTDRALRALAKGINPKIALDLLLINT
jgi:DNA polymerase-3 subunit delta'